MAITLGRMHMLFYSIAVLFAVALTLTLISGIGLYVAVIWNLLSMLNVSYPLLLPFSLGENAYILTADILDTIAFALLTVVLATMFFNFIKKVNIRSRIIDAKVAKVGGHVILAPYNRFALYLAQEMKKEDMDAVVVVANERDRMDMHRHSILSVVGDIKSVDAFIEAGAKRARRVVACSDSDIENALITITAKAANPSIEVVSRVSSEDDISKIGSAGALRMVMPEVTVGAEIGDVLAKRFQ